MEDKHVEQTATSRILIISGKMGKLAFKPEEVCNINVGVMGHVDSGKTSLGMLSCILFIK